MQDPLLPPSYQHGGGGAIHGSHTMMNGRAADLPAIRHYDDQQQLDNPLRFFAYGDASLRPNTGETNSYDTAIFGLALHELLENLRMANIVAAVVSMAALLASWLLRLLTGEIGKLVLAGYLAFFSFVLLLVEMLSIWNVQSVNLFLKDNFGMLRHPVGKTVFIYLLSTICFGIGGVTELLVGGIYFCSASLLLWTWCFYPEFRRPFEQEDREEDQPTRPVASEKTFSQSWSYYSGNFSSFAKTTSEHAALLGSAMRQKSAPV